MRKEIGKMVCLGIAALMFLGQTVYAENDTEDKVCEKSSKMKAYMDKIGQELGFTPEQQEQLKAQKTESRESAKGIRTKLKAKRAELKQELDKPEIDKAKVDAIVAEVKSVMAQQVDARVASILSMREILTAEQFSKLNEKMKQARGKRKRGGPGKRRRFKDKGEQCQDSGTDDAPCVTEE